MSDGPHNSTDSHHDFSLKQLLTFCLVEAIREVQKPVHYTALKFPGLHKDIIAFARTGRLAAGALTFVEAFVALRNGTALGRRYGIDNNAVSCKLYVSYEFTKTVNSPLDRPLDQFQVCSSLGSFKRISKGVFYIILG